MKKVLKHLSFVIFSLMLCFALISCEFVDPGKPTAKNAPVFHGVEDVTVERGTQFIPLEGVSVTDEEDGEIDLSLVTVDAHEVNVNVNGVYNVYYTVYDSDGNETKVVRVVTVVYTDTIKPNMYGVADTHVTIGDTSFTEMKDVSAIDNVDGNLEVAYEGSVNVWVPGEYHVVYTATDAAGNSQVVDRTVTVGLGNFEFEELQDLMGTEISGGEIIESIAPYGLIKFVFVVSSVEGAEVQFELAGATYEEKAYTVNGEMEIVIYARFDAPLEGAACQMSVDGDLQVTSIQYAFSGSGDHDAPVFSRSVSEEVYVPVGASAELVAQELLRGVSAIDNLDGNLTSKIAVDLMSANLAVAGEYEVALRVSDSVGNEAILPLMLNVAPLRDTHVILDPEFNESENGQFKMSSNGGVVSAEFTDGMFVITITTAGGWPSADSPYLSGVSTNHLAPGSYYAFKMDVKADVARQMQIRAGLELWGDPWIENFRDIVKYNITEEWTTIYYIFYVNAATSTDGSNIIKFEIQLGSINWSAAENNNVVYIDNAQFYLLTNDNKAPEITINSELPTTFAAGSEMPDFKAYFTAHDLEDGAIEMVDAMIDASAVNMAVAGTYEVVATVTDTMGVSTTATLTITVIAEADTQGPVITVPSSLLAMLNMFLPVKEGTDLTNIITGTVLPQISIVDDVDGQITATMEMVDLDGLNISSPKAGTYNITIQTKDSSGNDSNVVSITITVSDAYAPNFVGVRDYTVYVGQTVNPLAGVCGYDTTDGIMHLTLQNISGFEQFLDATGKVVGAAGEYQVGYTLTDAAGNSAQVTAVITVVAEEPEYNYNGAINLLAEKVNVAGGTSSTITYDGDQAVLNYAGVQGWYASFAQMKYYGVSLVPNTQYKLVIEAKAELPREFVIYFVDGDGNKIPGFENPATGNKLKVALTDEYYVYEYIFTPTSASSNNCTFEMDWDWEGFLINAQPANTIYFKQLKIVAVGENQELPTVFEPIVLDDFEGYADTEALAAEWAKRYSGVNYSTGFELVEVEGNKVVKFEYAADNKYLLRYVGSNFPQLTNDYKYVRLQAQLASEETAIEVWLYWSGSQNGVNFTPKNVKYSDGYYYFPFSSWNVKGAAVTGFAVGFNYKGGSVAYFDNIEFVADIPEGVTQGDVTAPVITINSEVLAAIAQMEFVKGQDLSQQLALLMGAVTITDETDGTIALTQEMIDLGGLNVTNPDAGSYTLTLTATDAAGNTASQSITIVVIDPDVAPKEYEAVYTIDFEDGAGSGTYVNAHWTQEKYSNDWGIVTNQMNSRLKGGSKVANVTSGWGMPHRYTYTFDTTLTDIAKFEITLGNYYSGKEAPVKILLVMTDDSVQYLYGSASEYYIVPTTTDMDVHLEIEFDAVDVKALWIIFNSQLQNSAYLYLDNIIFSQEKAGEVEPQEEEVEFELYMAGEGNGRNHIEGAGVWIWVDKASIEGAFADVTEVAASAEGFVIADAFKSDDATETFRIYVVLSRGVGAEEEVTVNVSFKLGNTRYSKAVEFKGTELASDEPEQPAQKEYEAVYTIDFEDGAGSGTYVNDHWTQEKYTSQWDVVTNQMNSRPKGGSKVANITSGYSMTHKYTYTFDTTLTDIAKFEMTVGNYYSQADAPIKVVLVKSDDSLVYLYGSSSEFYTVEQTTDMDIHLEMEFDAVDIKAFYIVFKSAKSSSAYLYLDNIIFSQEKAGEVEPQEEEVEFELYMAGEGNGRNHIEGAGVWIWVDKASIEGAFADVTEVAASAEGFVIADAFKSDDATETFRIYVVLSRGVGAEEEVTVNVSFKLGNTRYSKAVEFKGTELAGAEQEPESQEPVELLHIDFEDGTKGSTYVNSHWTQEKYTSAWETMSGQMNCREKGGSKVVNIVGGYSMTNKFTYTPDATIEGATKFEITLGNYFSNAIAAPIKIALVDTNNGVHYVCGSSSEFYNVPVTTGMDETISAEFDAIDVKAFYIVFKSSKNESVYLYLDDIIISK